MSIGALNNVRNDGLSHTTVRIGRGLPQALVADVIRALQRVPGVLTVDADAEKAQAFVAHDAGVPITALLAAANQAGAAAKADTASGAAVASAEASGAPQRTQRRFLLAAIGLAAMCAVILIDIAFPNSPDKRWPFVAPVIVLWAFVLLRATRTRRS